MEHGDAPQRSDNDSHGAVDDESRRQSTVAADHEANSGAVALSLTEETRVCNPSDLTLFLALMEFAEALLPAIEDALMLQWAHIMLIELAALSARFPHISGFYKVRFACSLSLRCPLLRFSAEPDQP